MAEQRTNAVGSKASSNTTRPKAPGQEAARAAQGSDAGALVLSNVSARYGAFRAVKDVSLAVRPKSVTALIGPSGCGKSTLIRTINRMHETLAGATVEGTITLDGVDLYSSEVDPVRARSVVGMVFQKPNPFPTMSIRDNVSSGVRLASRMAKGDIADLVEASLRRAALWDEVKDKLNQPGTSLSGGQQQRLCIARTIAVKPRIVLMDEPCSALDPVATLKIEELIRELATEYTIVIVTHNMQQASRVSTETAFFSMDEDRAGYLVEFGLTSEMFTKPKQPLTESYIQGRFG